MIFYFTDRSKAVLLIWFSVFAFSVSVSVLFLSSVCLDDIQKGVGSCVATFLELAVHSVYRMFSLYFDLL